MIEMIVRKFALASPFRLSTTWQDRDPARAVERLMASKTNATPQKEEVPKKEGETPRQPAARPVGCRGQEDDQARQEARLRHPRPAQRGAAVGGGVLRPDRGRLRDAQRDGHQRRRQRGQARKRRPRPRTRPTTTTTATASSSKPPRRPPRPARSRPSAPTIRSGCICARWARWSFCPARARSRSPSASRPAARR